MRVRKRTKKMTMMIEMMMMTEKETAENSLHAGGSCGVEPLKKSLNLHDDVLRLTETETSAAGASSGAQRRDREGTSLHAGGSYA